MNARSVFACLSALALAASGCSTQAEPPRVETKDTTAPSTTLDPAPGTFEEAVVVTLTASEQSFISYTVDGTDPATSNSATKGPSPQQVLLKGAGKVTLRYFAADTQGNAEAPKSATYGIVAKLAPASLSGEVRVHETMAAGSVVVALYDRDPSVQPAPQPVSYSALTVAGGHAGWKFESLPAGRYWVAAAWWPGSAQGDPQAYVIAHGSPFDLDPSDPAKARVDFVDLPFGMCREDAIGIDGVVRVSPEFQGKRVVVLAMDGPLTGAGGAKPLAASLAAGTGESRPFALCDVPAKPAYVVVAATPPGADDWEFAWVDPASPRTLQGLLHETYRVGSQDPALGTIAGTVSLSAPAVGSTIQVILTNEMPSGTSPLLQLVSLPADSALSYPYTLHNVGAGTYHVAAVLKRPGQRDAFALAANQPVIALPTAPLATADVTIGLGRLHGDVAVRASGAGQTVFVAGRRAGTNDVVATSQVTLGTADGTGARHAAYQLTGFPDGAFEVVAVYDANDDGQWQDDFTAGRWGRSPTITVANANDVAADVTVGP